MKKPILFGFTALCVLSTPNLIENFSHSTTKSLYRTIASQPEERDGKRHPKGPKPSDRRELEESRTTPPIPEGLPKEQKVTDIKDEKEDDKKIEKENDSDNSKEKEEIVLLEDIIEKDVTVCEYRNEINELNLQIKELLEDKKDVIAEVKDEDDKKEKKDDKDKKEKRNKDKIATNSDSRYQQILSMSLIFGQGFQNSYRMPMMRYNMNSLMNYSPMMNLGQTSPSWMSLMTTDFSSGISMVANSNSRLGQSNSTNSLSGNTRQQFIPTFNRNNVEAETIKFN